MTFQGFSLSNNRSPEEFWARTALIRRVQEARKIRAAFFGEDLFGDPAWDILLELYACELSQQRISVSSASAAAGVPATTALRWMAVLEEKNLIARDKDPFDARRVWVSLSSHGKMLMDGYLTETSVTSLTL